MLLTPHETPAPSLPGACSGGTPPVSVCQEEESGREGREVRKLYQQEGGGGGSECVDHLPSPSLGALSSVMKEGDISGVVICM